MANEEYPVAEETQKIMHIELSIGANKLMGNDVPKVLGKVNENENRSKIAITPGSREEAKHLFKELAVDGNIEVPLNDNPWGFYFGMFRDKFGIEWIINFES